MTGRLSWYKIKELEWKTRIKKCNYNISGKLNFSNLSNVNLSTISVSPRASRFWQMSLSVLVCHVFLPVLPATSLKTIFDLEATSFAFQGVFFAKKHCRTQNTRWWNKKISNIKVVEFSFENCTVAIKYRASFKSERFPSYESH